MKKEDLNNCTVDPDIAEDAGDQFAPRMEIEDADAEQIAGGSKTISYCAAESS